MLLASTCRAMLYGWLWNIFWHRRCGKKKKSIVVQCDLSSFLQRYSSSQWSKSVANSLGYASRFDKRTDHVKPPPYWHGFICLILFSPNIRCLRSRGILQAKRCNRSADPDFMSHLGPNAHIWWSWNLWERGECRQEPTECGDRGFWPGRSGTFTYN